MRILMARCLLYWSSILVSSNDLDLVSSGDGEGSGDFQDLSHLVVLNAEVNRSDIYFEPEPFVTQNAGHSSSDSEIFEHSQFFQDNYKHSTTAGLQDKQINVDGIQDQDNDHLNLSVVTSAHTESAKNDIVLSPVTKNSQTTTSENADPVSKTPGINQWTTKPVTAENFQRKTTEAVQTVNHTEANPKKTQEATSFVEETTTLHPKKTQVATSFVEETTTIHPKKTQVATSFVEETTTLHADDKGFLGNETLLCPNISVRISRTFIKLKQGASTSIQCKVYPVPSTDTQLSLMWHKEGEIICSSNRSHSDMYACSVTYSRKISLVIEVKLVEAVLGDSGTYTCSAQYSCRVDELLANHTITSAADVEVYDSASYVEEVVVIYSVLLGLLVIIVGVEMHQWKKDRITKNMMKSRIRSSIMATRRARIPLPPAIQDSHDVFEDIEFDTP